MVILPIQGQSKPYTVDPSKIIAVGRNYIEHLKEALADSGVAAGKVDLPKEPILFAKTPNVLIGNGEPIVIPPIVKRYGFPNPRTDHEAELAFIIGRRCRNIRPFEAMDYILGFTCMNDVSQRNIQESDVSGWFRGKSFDTFGPIGPVIVPPDMMGDVQNLRIICRVNGRVVQDGNTKDMIFGVRELLSFISENFTLEEGDIIMTGTPSGVGPLKDGDVVEVEIEKIGVLRNPVRQG